MDGFEPHGTIYSAGMTISAGVSVMAVPEGVPGVGRTGWAGRGYTGYYPATVPRVPYYTIFSLGPTYGQMKAILAY